MRILLILIMVLLSVNISGCVKDEESLIPKLPNENVNGGNSSSDSLESEEIVINEIVLTIGDKSFVAEVDDSEAAKRFLKLLPMSVKMRDLNRNEKYYYLPVNLPVSVYNPNIIHSGDIMLYGSNCLVLFYKTFSSSYGYTKIGSINNPDRLESVLGKGDVDVCFDIIKNEK